MAIVGLLYLIGAVVMWFNVYVFLVQIRRDVVYFGDAKLGRASTSTVMAIIWPWIVCERVVLFFAKAR